MAFRCAYHPVDMDARRWAELLFGRDDPRTLRLFRLRGARLAQSMSAELLCRDLLEDLAPGQSFQIEEDPSGKPRLSGCPLQLSISHSGGYVAAAIADTPVGIDLQELRTISGKLLQRYYSQEERAWIDGGRRTERAVRLWTMKEAYGKLMGTGLFKGLRFHAGVANGRLVTHYGSVSFLFPEAPEGLLFTVCLSEHPEADDPSRI